MEDLDQARATINQVDAQMAALFARRMGAVANIAAYKAERGLPIHDAQREAAVLQQNAASVDDEIRPYYVSFLEHTMEVSRQYQHHLMEGARVAYSGVEGAFAWVAARRCFPDAQAVAYPDFQHAYDAVRSGECDFAVLPVENSTAGEVGQVVDLLFSGPLYVNRMFKVPVVQNLLGIPGATLADIQTVVSHPQALAQCAEAIERHGWQAVEAANTAIAARDVAEAGDAGMAAIASAETAELYGLAVLDHDINESADNTTRFAVVSRVASEQVGNRFLLMFTVRNEAGSLAKAINVIGEHGFNMHMLSSRPMKSLAWQYYFSVVAEGDIRSQAGLDMMGELARQCDRLKVVGCYNEPKEILR